MRQLLTLVRGHDSLDRQVLRQNLSFVLHEHSSSEAVIETANACERHARAIQDVSRGGIAIHDTPMRFPETGGLVLTARIGAPELLATTLARRDPRLRLLFADHIPASTPPVTFFRAEANLTLPASTEQPVVVAGMVMRPGYRSAHLVTHGPFEWPDDRRVILRSLEQLIQAHVDQWMPLQPLWPAPAESLLPASEIELPE